MDKSELDFLMECQNELASLKERIGVLEAQISTLQEKLSREPEEVDFTGVEIGVMDPISLDIPSEIASPEPAVEEPEPFVVEPEPPVVEPETDAVSAPAGEPAPAVADDTAGYSWRKDNPGMMVKNIRSGISLLDRAQFIGTLFQEDFALYDNTIAALNGMETLDQAVAYIREQFPEWNLGSDVVYRFMMAIRKKLG